MHWFIAFLVLLTSVPANAQQIPVDLELVLAVDGSASVDYDEFNLQMTGIADAFRHPKIISSISEGAHGRIAVTLMIWSGKDAAVGGIDWHLIFDSNSSRGFAAAIQDMFRPVRPGGTAINAAIRNALQRIHENEYEGTRKIVDVSGDGRENNAVDALSPADIGRQEALARGVTINGLPILTDDPTLPDYFRQSIVGGPGAFMITAQDYQDFSRAIYEKLLREIRGESLIGASDGLPNG